MQLNGKKPGASDGLPTLIETKAKTTRNAANLVSGRLPADNYRANLMAILFQDMRLPS